MRIEYDGDVYDFEMSDISIRQAIKIEKHLGCSITEFGDRLQPGDDKPPDMLAIQCLGWLILHDGRGVPIEDTDFSVMKLMQAFAVAAAAEREAAEAAEAAAEPGAGPTGDVPASNGQTPAASSEPFSAPASL